MELIKKIKGVGYFNDALSADFIAANNSLQLLPGQVIWIVGALDELTDCSALRPLIGARKIRAVICLSREKGVILENFYKDSELIMEANSMEEAVQIAFYYAKENESVLFSPAGSTFNIMSKSIKELETQFINSINKLYIEN